jgi:DNA processing protein
VADRGFTVVSGAAYGIDGSAQTAALRAGGRTIAVLAGGIDRAYPRPHEPLLAEIAATGAVMSEVPLGSAPMKNRFLKRNRMIATMTDGTVVVEAALRSGALSTARLAADHGRPVGAVPGPVTSPVSAGCHQALREGYAVAVTDPAEVAELVGRIGSDVAPRSQGPSRSDWDDLDEPARGVLESLPRTRGSAVERVAAVAGLGRDLVRATLGRLARLGLAERDGAGWRQGASVRRGGLPDGGG